METWRKEREGVDQPLDFGRFRSWKRDFLLKEEEKEEDRVPEQEARRAGKEEEKEGVEEIAYRG